MAAAVCGTEARLRTGQAPQKVKLTSGAAPPPVSPPGGAAFRGAALLSLLALQVALCRCGKPAALPAPPGEPFQVYWNAPTQQCQARHGTPLALGPFGVVANPAQAFAGPRLAIFYLDQLGLYPFYDASGWPVNGGCPQNTSLAAHSEKLAGDVRRSLPWPAFSGLAVVDWEEWRPQWERNWAGKAVYQRKSRELVRALRPDWPAGKVEREAAWEFDTAARRFLTETLRLARGLRPGGLWGLYLFPDCYNHEYKRGLRNYTGRCPPLELRRNDALGWLFSESAALYPSVYLQGELRSSPQARLFARARVGEALRVASSTPSPASLPVFVYSRPFYANSLAPLTEMDLVSTIGESAALGASGVVLWGGVDYSRSRDICLQLNTYLKSTLGPYILNVTTAARLCSRHLCSSRGRCVRREPDSDAFLHLDARAFRIQVRPGDGREGEPLVSVQGELSRTARAGLRQAFRCHCYQGRTGGQCQSPASRAPRTQPGTALLFSVLCAACTWQLWGR
ncbi:hyaluronidase-2-like isoform X2 [Lepisosteus oculatus]|uniref:hyaluronidase-2-like isoform X2 n=1 Tax=Lepisosteus oculatus TaxID=7918 RepID=UPI0037246DC2